MNRILLGRSVATEIQSQLSGYKAWIHISHDYDLTEASISASTDFGEPRLLSTERKLPNGYTLTHIQIHEKYLEFGYDLHLAWEDSFTMRQVSSVANEDELEIYLSRWFVDLHSLREPMSIGYPYLPMKSTWDQ